MISGNIFSEREANMPWDEITRRVFAENVLWRQELCGKVISFGIPDVPGGFKPWIQALGYGETLVIDASLFEEADFRWDLNDSIPPELWNSADLVIDPGTLEHVFDIKTFFANIAHLLKIGGLVFHFNPLNLVDHGFFSPSPCLFHDVYTANGFEILATIRRNEKTGECGSWDLNYEEAPQSFILGGDPWFLYTVACKVKDCVFTSPIQSRWPNHYWKGKL